MGKHDLRSSSIAAGGHHHQRCVLAGLLKAFSPGGAGALQSSSFTVQGQRWRVRLQCPVSLSCNSPYVSVLLAAAGDNTGRTRAHLRLLNHLDPSRSLDIQAERDFSGAKTGAAMGDRAAISLETLCSVHSGFIQDGMVVVCVELWQSCAVKTTPLLAVECDAWTLRDGATAAAKGRAIRRTRRADTRARPSIGLAMAGISVGTRSRKMLRARIPRRTRRASEAHSDAVLCQLLADVGLESATNSKQQT